MFRESKSIGRWHLKHGVASAYLQTLSEMILWIAVTVAMVLIVTSHNHCTFNLYPQLARLATTRGVWIKSCISLDL